MNHKRKKRKIKTVNGYLPGDGPRGNSKQDQTKRESILDDIAEEQISDPRLRQSLRVLRECEAEIDRLRVILDSKEQEDGEL